MAAVNKKMSIAILSKNLCLVLFSCGLSSVWLFCLYCCTNSFIVPGALSNLLSKGVDCNEIGELVPVLSNFDSLPNLVPLVLC